jgi:hypothetical protein
MARFGAAAWLLLAVAVASMPLPAYQVAQANPIVKDGQAITLKGADDLGATADRYLRDFVIRLGGLVMGVTGLAMMPRNPGSGLTVAGGGVGMEFLPSIIGSTADQVAAAPSLVFPLQTLLAVSLQYAGIVLAEACLVTVVLIGYRQWRRRVV